MYFKKYHSKFNKYPLRSCRELSVEEKKKSSNFVKKKKFVIVKKSDQSHGRAVGGRAGPSAEGRS